MRSTRRYGGVTIVAARFMPFLRTFAPFVAGVAQMTRRRFTLYDVTGGALWIGSVTLAGYLFGNIPWVKENLDKIIWGAILIPGLLVLIGAWRARMKQAKTRPELARRADAGRRPAALAFAVAAARSRGSGCVLAGQACCW